MGRDDLVVKWERKAAEFQALAANVDAAAMCQLFVADLQALAAESRDDWILIGQAPAFSGYSKQHIRRLIQSGQLPAEGEGRARRVLLRALPRKPAAVATPNAELHLLGATAEQAVRESVGAS